MNDPLATPLAATRPAPAAAQAGAAAQLQVEPDLPEISPARSLTGWHREFCVELQGEGRARIFVRAVQHSSLKATELKQAVLFRRLDPRFSDLDGCVEALKHDLERLAVTARRAVPSKDNLFTTVVYDRGAWERIEQGVDRWARR